MSELIRLEKVSKRFGRIQALDQVSLNVPSGRLFGLIGPDGAGKSTLMKIVVGVLAQDAGEVTVLGQPIRDERSAEAIKSHLGFMPQGLGLNLYPTLSVEEHLRFFARLHGLDTATTAQRIEQLLLMTDMTHARHRAMKHLSGGMKQKLGLMCALIHQPRLLVLDEPTTGVDPISRRAFWALLAQIVYGEGATALVSTAYMDEAARFDQIALVDSGRVLSVGAAEQLLRANDAGDLESLFLTLQGQKAEPLQVPTPPLPDAPVRIEARNLTRRFGEFIAVDQVSFQVRAGEIFGLLGANGAGKSTLIRMLTGVLTPSEGEGYVAGEDMRRSPLRVRQRIGYMSQHFSLYEKLSVLENLKLFARIYGLRGRRLRQRVEWALKWADLTAVACEHAQRLPLGLRQRLALAAAVVHEPEVVFLDEPTSGVDPAGRRHFWRLIGTLAKRGVAVLVTTHAMDEASLCHRLVLMRSGRTIANDTPQALIKRTRQEAGDIVSLQVDRPWAAYRLLQQQGKAAFLVGRSLHLFSRTPQQTAEQLRQQLDSAGFEVESVEILTPQMEEVFFHLVEGAK